MPVKLICLANSLKEGGRCLAGIEVDANNNPVIVNARPKWIRPVSINTVHGEVPNKIAQPFQLLNILQVDGTYPKPDAYQSENVTFNQRTLKAAGSFDCNQLMALCDTGVHVFGTKGKAVSQQDIGSLNHSLMLVSVSEFEITKIVYHDRPDKPQVRLVFKYNNHAYDFPITDPAFLSRYYSNADVLKGVPQIYLCLSLGIAWKDWYYKLVAGIIY